MVNGDDIFDVYGVVLFVDGKFLCIVEVIGGYCKFVEYECVIIGGGRLFGVE